MSTAAVLVLPFFIVSLVASGPLIKADSSQVMDTAKISPVEIQKIELSAQNSPILADSSITQKSGVKPKKVIQTLVTAYSSTPDQTDDTPFITASGSHVRNGVIASNFLAFGTQVRLPALFGDKVFTVEDRLRADYNDRVDVWFPTKAEAKKFGIKALEMEIL